MPVLTKEVQQQLENKIISRLLNEELPDVLSSEISKAISEKINLPKIINEVRSAIPTPQDGKDAKVSEDMIASMVMQVLEKTQELIQVKDGRDGKPGETGPKGDKGDTGLQGLKGDPGRNGTDGINGQNGRDGLPGINAVGKQGERGLAGKDGRPYVLSEKDIQAIVSRIPEPKDGKDAQEIDVSEVLKQIDFEKFSSKKDIEAIIKKLKFDIERGAIRFPHYGGGGGSVAGENPYEKYLKVTSSGDDEGLRVENGQLSVGTPSLPQESVFGGGDSYPVPVAYHCKVSDTAGLTIVNAIDITEILQSDGSSTTSLFGGVAVGDYFLVGSAYFYGGIKAKIDTLGVVERGSAIPEYLQDNTPTWVPVPFMVTESEFPYEQKSDRLATVSNSSEHWRFGFNPLDRNAQWDMVTLNINGVDDTQMWARFRLGAIITTDPIIEQIKIHSDRLEIEADGSTAYYGSSRYARTLLIHQRLLDELDGLAPKDQTIDFAVGISVKMKKNKFEDNQIDGYGGIVTIPEGLDTSIPIQLVINYIVSAATAGDIELEFKAAQLEVGGVLDGLHPVDFSQTTVVSIGTNEENILKQTLFLISVSELEPGEFLAFSLSRDATAGNVIDTYVGNFNVVSVTGIGYFWKP